MKPTYLSLVMGAACVSLGLAIGVLAYGVNQSSIDCGKVRPAR